MDITQFAKRMLAPANELMGPLQSGHYIQIGLGFGFYVDESDFQMVQRRATETRQVQFLGVTKSGTPLYGSRDEIVNHPDSAGVIAWIFPQDIYGGAAGSER